MSDSGEEGPDCENEEGVALDGEGEGKGKGRRTRAERRKRKRGKGGGRDGEPSAAPARQGEKLPAHQVVKPGDWTCPKCSNNVWASKDACGKCGFAKGGDRGGGDRGGGHSFGRPPPGPPPQHFGPVDSFSRFAAATRLPPAELTDWEHDLRRPLLDVLQYLNGPLPLVEWINARLGGELETFFDETGAVMVRLRPGFAQPARGPPPGRGQPLVGGPPPTDMEKDNSRRDAFFEKLPDDSFNNSEIKLRSNIFEFLATWQSTKKATLADLAGDAMIEKVRSQFVPKVVTLREWIERRMGEEILFRTDRSGIDIVDVTQAGQEGVSDMIEDLAAKRRGEGDTNPQGGKRQRTN